MPRTSLGYINLELAQLSEECDDVDDELDCDPLTGVDRARQLLRRTRWLDQDPIDGEYDEQAFKIDGICD